MKLLKLCACALVLILLNQILFVSKQEPVRAIAQAELEGWAPLTLIYTSSYIDRPVLAPDLSGALHVLWWGQTPDQGADTPPVIIYMRWDGKQWTEPTDVIVGPGGGQAKLPEALVDANGTLHVVWAGPQLFYSTAPAWAAEDPHTWSAPREIGNGQTILTPDGLAVAPDGSLHVAFAVASSGEIHYTSLTADGQNWALPQSIYAAPSNRTTLFSRLAVDSRGNLHAVWSEAPRPDGYPPLGVLYSNSTDGGVTWSQAVELAGAGYGEGTIVVAPDDTLHVVYNGQAGVEGRYHRFSTDGGLTWSDRAQVMPPDTGGLTGNPGLITDTRNALYFLGNEATFGEWHGRDWSALQDLRVLAPEQLDFIEQATLTIVGGNQLHVVFWDGRERLWHTWRTIDAPALAPLPYPTVTPTPTPVVTQTPTPDAILPTATPPVLAAVAEIQPSGIDDPVTALLISIGPGILLVIGVLLISLIRRRA